MSLSTQPPLQAGTVSAYVLDRISDLLNRRRVVVWFDGRLVFRPLLPKIQRVVVQLGGMLIDGTESELAARRSADAAYQQLEATNGLSCLLVYLPRARARATETWREDLFASYGVVGATFGDHEDEHLRELALAAWPAQRAAIERQFKAGQPTLASLDGLAQADGVRWPLIRQALGTDDPVEAIVRFLRADDANERLAAIPGAGAELRQMLTSALGLSIEPGAAPAIDRGRLLAYLLLSELAHDLPDGLPSALVRVDHATGAAGDTALEVLARLRESDAGRAVLREATASIKKSYQIARHLPAGEGQLGTRDTFPVQDNLRLRAVVVLAEGDKLTKARDLASVGKDSLWREDPERSQLWAAVGQCLDFLALAGELQPRLGSLPSRPAELIEQYITQNGFWRLDQAQRRFEQGAIACHFDDDLEPLVQRCRGRYLELTGLLQQRFQRAVKDMGWPPEGVRRQTRVFDEQVTPELQT